MRLHSTFRAACATAAGLAGLFSWAQPGTLDLAFNPGAGANGTVSGVHVQPDGRAVIAGSFTDFDGQPAGRIARLNTDGALDGSFASGTGFNDAVLQLLAQSDGKLLVRGIFNSYDGTVLNGHIARLNPDGTLDETFTPPNLGGVSVNAMALAPDGRIVLGLGTSWPSRVIRLEPDGAIDPSFSTLGAFNGIATVVAVHPDGRVLVSGTFTAVNGQSRPGLALLNTDGSLDTSFDPGTGATAPPGPSAIQAMAIRPSGEALIGGALLSYNGVAVNRIVQVLMTGAIDAGFNPGAAFNGLVSRIRLLPDGRAWCMGAFTEFDGSAAHRLCLLNSDGSREASFSTAPGANGDVLDVAGNGAGRQYIAGAFTYYAAVPRNRIARVFDCAPVIWYADSDGDGLGDPSTPLTTCPQPESHVANADDCDDANPLVGLAPLWYADADGDGFGDPNMSVQACAAPDGHVNNGFDCDDSDPDILTVYGLYPDADGDGFGDTEGYVESCTPLAGYVENDLDCDDTDPLVGDDYQPFYQDMDGDGFGGALFGWFCTAPEGYVGNNQDCNDNDPDLYIGAPCDDGDPLTHDAIDANCNCISSSVFASIYVKLQGAYIGNGLQRSTLHQLGLMPIQEPYTALGYQPAPNSIAEGSTMAPQQVPHDQYHQWVDWVVVELRDANDPSVPVTTRYGLLNVIGQIIDPVTDGIIRFPVPPGFYHVAVLHRNHRGVVTQDPIDFTVDFDVEYPIIHFDLPSTPVIGGASARFHDPDSGYALLNCGDVTFNDQISYVGAGNDRDPMLVAIGGSTPNTVLNGQYRQEDINLDGQVKYVGEGNDRDPILLTVGGNLPTNTLPNVYLRQN